MVRTLLLALLFATPLEVAARDLPDFTGTWDFGSLTPLERPETLADQTHFTPEQARQFEEDFDGFALEFFKSLEGDGFVGVDLWLDFGTYVEPDYRTSRIVDPPNGKLPERTSIGQERQAAGGARRMSYAGPEVLSPTERCIWNNVPILREPDNNMMMIVQTNDHLAILREYSDSLRIIPLASSEGLPSHMLTWRGDSHAEWDGDTLVIHTDKMHPKYTLLGAGSNMKLTERLSLSGPDQLRYEFTVDDPEHFTAPFTVLTYIQRSDKMLYEYSCHEGNFRSMQGIFAGARLLEREAAE